VDTQSATVFVVDDDADVRRALTRLLRAGGFGVTEFGSARDFLACHNSETSGCLLLDVAMPDVDGLELQELLLAAGSVRPIVFLTGNADIPTSVQAMKAGAANFLTKPVNTPKLFAAVTEALKLDATARRLNARRHALQRRLSTLTSREREVLAHLVAGERNKQIAADLGIVEKTIKVHRARLMRKMGVRSMVELVYVAGVVGLAEKLARCVPQPTVAHWVPAGRRARPGRTSSSVSPRPAA
jgi:FixJ family two-component response regulator